ncbi:hypothetical protein NO995_08940 [Aestuariibaculum sp. M13]|uniref:hypothetical protein n=1 Tax=Aestuariibaculum sp. M13 TaxID=2967132 RepID=UPI002159ECE7|nr:hypothetical protein [Aestuariibaculum sp. M13]MCR8667805.1 hypothetical protein [Aestuariibaculum sp. M13]
MKKLIYLFALSISFLACEGPQGPPGLPGSDGGLFVASAFEIEINFNAANNYEYIENYGFDVYPSDVVMVYISWETDNGQDIWRALPQTTYFNEGTLIYNFDFTQDDVRFFLDGDIDFSILASEWTQNQVFRVVVIPADNVDGLDLNNYNNVIESLNIQSFKAQ